ncbi:hypothetical protein Tsubulata_031855 [Turnera subulata]|uniref:Uncharacterized protein n=1 Tax=Turnera subulata TaxID=218843 RepID=A0A9Q0FS10_9ROSI|nr:hypothetical protein Tsubulata_031855 [Turnera subulata]
MTGLLLQNRGNMAMEEIGEKCVEDLVARSFLQRSTDNPRLLSMHDLVNDLARFVCGEFCFRVEKNDRSKMATVRTIYLPFDCGPNSDIVTEQIENAIFSRTIFHSSGCDEIAEAYLDLLTALPGLRVEVPSPRKLPDSIGRLKHLRHMDLSYWEIHCLPDDVCTLYSLQTLILRGCWGLVELPDLLGNLKNFRCLDLRGTRNLVRLPASMNGLKNLRHLDIRDTKISEMPPQLGIAELGPLEHLRGELSIRNLQNVVDPSHASGANLKGKKYIEKLELKWGGDDGRSRSLSEQILEQLRPTSYLKALEVYNYPGVRLPNWLGEHCPVLESDLNILPEGIESSMGLEEVGFNRCHGIRSFQLGRFKNLSSLELANCWDFESLCCGDEEGPLTSLHYMSILNCSKFISFPGQGLQALNLKELSLAHLHALEGLPKHMHSLLPSLKELTLSHCTKLRSFPEGGFPPNLKKLEITNCGKLVADRKNWGLQPLQSLSSLDISGCEESFPEETLLPSSLNSLSLWYFEHLKSLDYKGLEHLSSLKALNLYWCPQLQSLPEEGLSSSLQYLYFHECSKTLEERCQENGRDWHKISHIPRITINDKEIKPRQSTQVRIDQCWCHLVDSVKARLSGQHHATSCKELTLRGR